MSPGEKKSECRQKLYFFSPVPRSGSGCSAVTEFRPPILTQVPLFLTRCRSGAQPQLCERTPHPSPGPENCRHAARGPGSPEASFCALCSSHILCKAARSASAAPGQTGSFAPWQRGSLRRAASGDSCLLEERQWRSNDHLPFPTTAHSASRYP